MESKPTEVLYSVPERFIIELLETHNTNGGKANFLLKTDFAKLISPLFVASPSRKTLEKDEILELSRSIVSTEDDIPKVAFRYTDFVTECAGPAFVITAVDNNNSRLTTISVAVDIENAEHAIDVALSKSEGVMLRAGRSAATTGFVIDTSKKMSDFAIPFELSINELDKEAMPAMLDSVVAGIVDNTIGKVSVDTSFEGFVETLFDQISNLAVMIPLGTEGQYMVVGITKVSISITDNECGEVLFEEEFEVGSGDPFFPF